MIQPTDKHREEARAIRLPFPCGCLDAHSGGGMTVEEFTCEAHNAIAAILSSRDAEIREVLEGLALRRDIKEGGHCWCYKNLTNPNEAHRSDCLAARGLWERVQG